MSHLVAWRAHAASLYWLVEKALQTHSLHLLKENAIMTFGCNLSLALASVCLLAPCASGGPVNLALGMPAPASGYYGSSIIGNGNDGDTLNTAWNGGAWAAWWQVDLQASFPIDNIKVFSSDGAGLHITFQLTSSTDGSNWSPIGPWTTGYGYDGNYRWDFTFPTAGAEMRYIRFTTLGDSGSDWATLFELQANQDQGQVPEPATFVLLAAGFTALGLARGFRHQ
jgi:hypothetical protein